MCAEGSARPLLLSPVELRPVSRCMPPNTPVRLGAGIRLPWIVHKCLVPPGGFGSFLGREPNEHRRSGGLQSR